MSEFDKLFGQQLGKLANKLENCQVSIDPNAPKMLTDGEGGDTDQVGTLVAVDQRGLATRPVGGTITVVGSGSNDLVWAGQDGTQLQTDQGSHTQQTVEGIHQEGVLHESHHQAATHEGTQSSGVLTNHGGKDEGPKPLLRANSEFTPREVLQIGRQQMKGRPTAKPPQTRGRDPRGSQIRGLVPVPPRIGIGAGDTEMPARIANSEPPQIEDGKTIDQEGNIVE